MNNDHNVVDLSSYQNLNVYFLVTLGKVNRECAFPDAKLKEINKVIKNGCNTISTSSKECYCDTDLCNTNIASRELIVVRSLSSISKCVLHKLKFVLE